MISATKKIFRLGRVLFSVESESEGFAKTVDQLFFTSEEENCGKNILDLKMNENVRLVLNEILNQHSECIWLDAACIVSKSGKKVLISGLSGAGKSTTAMAMVWGFGWTALGEDLVLIDPRIPEVISFPSPFSLKPGTLEILRTSIDNLPSPILDNEWVPYLLEQIAPNSKAEFDFAFQFESAKSGRPFLEQKISSAEYLRKVLPCSNLIHHEAYVDSFFDSIRKANCVNVVGGTLDERIALLLTAGGD